MVTKSDFNIVISNNSPKEYAELFSRDIKDRTLKSILDFDVVIFKNCYPTTELKSDRQLSQYKDYYLDIAKNLSRFQNKKFILVTSPPLRKEQTKIDYANRAIILNNWLNSKEFVINAQNLYVFDLFGYLADKNGMLRNDYTNFWPFDSHPNSKANKSIATLLAKFITSLVK